MRFLIKSFKCFYWLAVAVAIGCVYGLITQGLGWTIYTIAMVCLAIFLKEDIKCMEKDIEDCQNSLACDIEEFCHDMEPGIYTLDLEYDDKIFTVKFRYDCEAVEEEGAEFMGAYERLVRLINSDITILELKCECEDGSPYDYGFNAADLQERL